MFGYLDVEWFSEKCLTFVCCLDFGPPRGDKHALLHSKVCQNLGEQICEGLPVSPMIMVCCTDHETRANLLTLDQKRSCAV